MNKRKLTTFFPQKLAYVIFTLLLCRRVYFHVFRENGNSMAEFFSYVCVVYVCQHVDMQVIYLRFTNAYNLKKKIMIPMEWDLKYCISFSIKFVDFMHNFTYGPFNMV